MSRKVILLVNLGSPDSPGVNDVKRYLNEFLMDKRVIDFPWFWRWMLVKGIIVPFRARGSSKKYKSIWTKNGSPLVQTTNALAKKLERVCGLPVYTCMRYANPNPLSVLEKIYLANPNIEELVVTPLYPHYAMSSYETAVVHVKAAHEKGGFPFPLKIVKPYYNNDFYIKALVESIKPLINIGFDHLLFTYHGIPERHILKSDITAHHCLKGLECCETPSPAHANCYLHQVKETTRLVVKELGLAPGKYSLSFQSRLGRERWLEPSTVSVLKSLPGKGVKKLVVVSPSFACDCLETLEEINMEGRHEFLNAGGGEFIPIPCLNDNEYWVNALAAIVELEGDRV